MARKLLLVPAEQYQRMLGNEKLAAAADGLSDSEQRMKSLLKSSKASRRKRSDRSAKKALFEQEKHRFLKLKKQKEEEPVRVSVVSGGDGSEQVPAVRKGAMLAYPDDAEQDANVTVESVAQSENTPVANARPTKPISAPTAAVVLKARKPSQRHQEHEAANARAVADNQQRFRQLTALVGAKKDKLGITPTGQVIDNATKQPIYGSNYLDILKNIIRYSPSKGMLKGQYHLQNRLEKESDINSLINSFKPTKRSPPKGAYKPQTWS